MIDEVYSREMSQTLTNGAVDDTDVTAESLMWATTVLFHCSLRKRGVESVASVVAVTIICHIK